MIEVSVVTDWQKQQADPEPGEDLLPDEEHEPAEHKGQVHGLVVGSLQGATSYQAEQPWTCRRGALIPGCDRRGHGGAS